MLKRMVQGIARIVAFPGALLAGFGRFGGVFEFFAHVFALAPGLPGSYLRVAYYSMTLRSCSMECHIGLGSFFAHAKASVGYRVYIGSLCVLGQADIGDRTQIASGVQILSGRRQHPRGSDGRMQSSDTRAFEVIHIGADCWIGAGAILMADIGEGTTIGAGSVVTRPIPAHSVAVGNPARVIKSTQEA
ncbi:MAG TPA: DapH/DapD/GlmU-related protein [Bryobacteraceae bacterium]|jgi:acetyltransferase-like isoleucine patch superfamily enzyme